MAREVLYDPDTGRFINQDTYLGENSNPPSLHRYLYAYNNPNLYTDPDGHETIRTEDQPETRYGVKTDVYWDVESDQFGSDSTTTTILIGHINDDGEVALTSEMGDGTVALNKLAYVTEEFWDRYGRYTGSSVVPPSDISELGLDRQKELIAEYIAKRRATPAVTCIAGDEMNCTTGHPQENEYVGLSPSEESISDTLKIWSAGIGIATLPLSGLAALAGGGASLGLDITAGNIEGSNIPVSLNNADIRNKVAQTTVEDKVANLVPGALGSLPKLTGLVTKPASLFSIYSNLSDVFGREGEIDKNQEE